MRFFVVFLTAFLSLSPATLAAAQEPKPDPKRETSQVLPGFDSFLVCSNFTWMQNCREINQWVSENPDKPLRLKRDGIEFYFPPGTPSPTIDWVVNQSPESLERYLNYLERLSERNRKSAAMYGKALEARGGKLRGEVGLDYFLMPPAESAKAKIHEQNVAIYVFVDPACTACATFEPRIAQLRSEYPRLTITILQVNGNRKAADAVEKRTGVRVRPLTKTQFAQYRSNVRAFPTVWIEDQRTKRTSVLTGAVTYPELARQISRLSK